MPQLTRRCREALEDLENTIAEEPRRAREELMEHVGPIRVRTTAKQILLEAEDGYLESALLSAAGAAARRQTSLVAGM